MRVFELSKKIGITSKELIAFMSQMDIEVKSHMTTLTEDDVQAVLKKGGFPSPKKSGTKAKAKKLEAPPNASPPKKKRFILIKKKKAPPVEPIPVVDEVFSEEKVTEKTPEEGAAATVAEIAPIEPAAPAESIETPPAVEESPSEEHAATIEPKVVDLATGEAVADSEKIVQAATTVTPGKEKKKEKKKEKLKRGRRSAQEDLAPKRPAEGRKWQDFKPIHKKSDRRPSRKAHGPAADTAKPRKKVIKIYEGLSVKDFSELIGQKVNSIIAKLMELGKMATINQAIDVEEASLIAEAFGIHTEIVAQKTEAEILMQSVPDDPALRISRPPVITIMGHVDHGKTSLLDAIRKTSVTSGEAGGITQHIGAYTVDVSGKKITFLDTPGHAAFTAMRARGAKVTDIVVLVIAADDGVMPQTKEAINHAKVAGAPIIVAINKIDRPDANPDRVKQALSEFELIPEDWGGNTIFTEVSATKNIGLDHLLEMILLQAEVLELKANPKRSMMGAIIEAKIDRGRGPVATVLVQDGTLKVGNFFVTGPYFGKVRALINDKGKKVKEAEPSMPVEVIGLDGVPLAGDTFVVVENERTAKSVAGNRSDLQRKAKLSQPDRPSLEELYERMQEEEGREQKVILKADVRGSAEALKESMENLSTDAVKLSIIHTGVGGITESDVLLAAASNAVVIGFNIRPESKVRRLAEKEKVDLRFYSIIYEVIADVRGIMEGLLEPTLEERMLGKAEVRQIFSVPKLGVIAGSYILEGVAPRNCAGIRVIREEVVLHEGKLASLRRFKDDVKEVKAGYECGIGIEGFKDIQPGDTIELYTFDKISAKLESA